MTERFRAYALTLTIAGLVASPLVGFFSSDSFPISNYPMFASARPATVSLPHVIVVHEDGSESPASPSDIANDEVMQALQTLRQAIRHGDAATATLCDRIAARVAGSGAATVSIVTSRYDAVRYYAGDREPIERVLHTICEVQP